MHDAAVMKQRLPRRAAAVLDDDLGDGHIVLDPRSGEYFRLEGTAAAVWEMCDGRHTEEAIVAEVAERFGAPAAQVRSDVAAFLEHCVAAQLVDFA
jgi:pyrroloquinoline quinone biosynthesis protein D